MQALACNESIAPVLSPLMYPVMFFHPLLLDEEGRKVGTDPVPAAYAIDDDLKRYSPTDVWDAIMLACNLPPAEAPYEDAGRFYNNVRGAAQPGSREHTQLYAKIRLPEKWKEFIR